MPLDQMGIEPVGREVMIAVDYLLWIRRLAARAFALGKLQNMIERARLEELFVADAQRRDLAAERVDFQPVVKRFLGGCERRPSIAIRRKALAFVKWREEQCLA